MEKDIINILEGYQYDFRSNVLINGYEVDALVGGRLIIEYNGFHHYAINSSKLVQSLYDDWRVRIFKQRRFIVSSIPYEEWKFIDYFEDKRLYLVRKIEEDLLR